MSMAGCSTSLRELKNTAKPKPIKKGNANHDFPLRGIVSWPKVSGSARTAMASSSWRNYGTNQTLRKQNL